ncbi:MAG: hypothetical protein FE78DRAFT_30782 [Acidomyces sp. 'richmondensis']|nr:MAG: hypothetical protein FE78DRAFT_30782 [Acidomyces sp. 'richmondensis']
MPTASLTSWIIRWISVPVDVRNAFGLRSIRLRLKEQLERVEDKEEKLVEEQEALLARIRTE